MTTGSSVGGGTTSVSAGGGVESSASTLVGSTAVEINEKRIMLVMMVSFLVRFIVNLLHILDPSCRRNKVPIDNMSLMVGFYKYRPCIFVIW